MYCAINQMISTNTSWQGYTEKLETCVRKLLSLGGNNIIMYVNVICTSYHMASRSVNTLRHIEAMW